MRFTVGVLNKERKTTMNMINTIKKLISVIIAIFVPITSSAPAFQITAVKRRPPAAASQQQSSSNSSMQFVEENEAQDNTAAETENKADETTNNEIANLPETEVWDTLAGETGNIANRNTENDKNTAITAKALKTWDISESDEDDVEMAFYANITASLKALFLPMTAYAAATAEIEPSDIVTFSEDAAPTGVLRISGTGDMEDAVYKKLVSFDRYEAATKELIAEEYDADYNDIVVDVPADVDKNDFLAVDAAVSFYSKETGQDYSFTEAMRDRLDPTKFLAFIPTAIIIEDGVENISDYAFVMCGAVETIVIPDSVTEIGDYAFMYCKGIKNIEFGNGLVSIGENAFNYCTALTEVRFPEGLKNIGCGAFENCANLKYVFLPENVEVIKNYAFMDLADDAVIICPTLAVSDVLNTYYQVYACEELILENSFGVNVNPYEGYVFDEATDFLIDAERNLLIDVENEIYYNRTTGEVVDITSLA